jgi:DNA-binding transcriptional LysR family regulator
VSIGACANEVWACGQPGSGMDALLRNVCNRLGHFEPDIRHRSDDGLILSALVASGRAVALLPPLLVSPARRPLPWLTAPCATPQPFSPKASRGSVLPGRRDENGFGSGATC